MKKAGAKAPALEIRGETARSEYGVAVLAGADADDVFERADEDFPVADFARAGGRGDRRDGAVQAIVGYADDYFEVLGSWGRNWADEGFVRIHESFFTTQNVGSRTTLTSSPAACASA